MIDELALGAVAYDPKVVTIWSGFRAWFRERGVNFDYILYSQYERQVDDLLDGIIDLAWNSPLAWIRAERLARVRGVTVRAAAMRDTDRDLTSVIVVPTNSNVESVGDLRGRVIATGAVDSPQSTLLPLSLLRNAGVTSTEAGVVRFDVGVGLHGDHIGGERAAALAMRAGKADAACMVDLNLLLFAREGVLPPDGVRILARTEPYDHCNLTAGPSANPALLERFTDLLLSMSYADADVRSLLDLEGLKKWLPGRTSRYSALDRAVTEIGFYDEKGDYDGAEYRP